jgi:hypothetical protein
MDEVVKSLLSAASGGWNAVVAAVEPINTLLAGGIASIVVGVIASAIGAHFQFRQTARREGDLRFHQFMSEHEQYGFSLPKAIANDLEAMRGGWDNVFYSAMTDSFSSTLYLPVMIGRFNREYLQYMSSDKRRFFEKLDTAANDATTALIDLAKSLPSLSIEDWRGRCKTTIDKIIACIAFSEKEFPKGYVVLNDASIQTIRGRLEESVETFMKTHPQAGRAHAVSSAPQPSSAPPQANGTGRPAGGGMN